MNTRQLIQECSSRHNPTRWLGINSVVLLWASLILLWILVLDDSDNHDADETTSLEYSYLVFNFCTTGLWMTEVAVKFLDWRGYFDSPGEESPLLKVPENVRSWKQGMALRVELALAVIFFLDTSSVLFYLTREQIHRKASGMAIDVCFNFAAYTYMVYEQCGAWRAVK